MPLRVRFPHDQCEHCQTVAFLAMGVGMDKITDGNWREFWTRLHIINAGEDMIGPEVICGHVGLEANVSPETKAQFKNKIAKNRRHEAEWALRRWEDGQKGESLDVA